MKKIVLGIAFLSIFTVSIDSCKKMTDTENANISSVSNKKNYTLASNPSNEYDFFGEKHNESLMPAFSDKLTVNSSKEDCYNYFNISTEGRNFLNQVIPFVHVSPSEYVGLMKEMYNENPKMFEYLESIRKIIKNSKGNLHKMIEGIKDFEKNYPYEIFPEEQRVYLKLTSSIARHSLYLWAPIEQGGLGYFAKIRGETKVPIDWWGVGEGDYIVLVHKVGSLG